MLLVVNIIRYAICFLEKNKRNQSYKENTKSSPLVKSLIPWLFLKVGTNYFVAFPFPRRKKILWQNNKQQIYCIATNNFTCWSKKVNKDYLQKGLLYMKFSVYAYLNRELCAFPRRQYMLTAREQNFPWQLGKSVLL